MASELMNSWQLRKIYGQLLLTQEHSQSLDCPCELSSEAEYCIPKHLIHIQSLTEESIPMFEDEKIKELLGRIAGGANDLRRAYEEAREADEEPPYDDIVDFSREARKELEQYLWRYKGGTVSIPEADARMLEVAVTPTVEKVTKKILYATEKRLGIEVADRFELDPIKPTTFDDAVMKLLSYESTGKPEIEGLLRRDAGNFINAIRNLQREAGISSPNYKVAIIPKAKPDIPKSKGELVQGRLFMSPKTPEQIAVEIEMLEETLANDPVAQHKGTLGKRKNVPLTVILQDGKVPENFTVKTATFLNFGKRPINVRPDGKVDRLGAMDNLAMKFGYGDDIDGLCEHIEKIGRIERRISELKYELESAKQKAQPVSCSPMLTSEAACTEPAHGDWCKSKVMTCDGVEIRAIRKPSTWAIEQIGELDGDTERVIDYGEVRYAKDAKKAMRD